MVDPRFAHVFPISCFSGLLIPPATRQENKLCKPIRHQDARDDILAFFGVRDALNISWLHAVNSPEKLEQGLSGDIMMLEADVLMRNNTVNGTPVMAHPPNVDSNLTLHSFLTQTTKSTKGIKLDFKTIEVVEPSLKMVQNVTFGQEFETPIWLNADILPGPCYDKVCVPVDHTRFLSFCKSFFPNGTLSISWTTGKNMAAPENFYNWSQVLTMGQLVSQIAQPITFPVRANLVGRSWEQLHWLLDLSETFTITIWSSTTDNPDVQDLVALRYNVSDKRRIYYDLPPDQEKAFKDALASSSDSSKGDSESFPWKATANKDCKDVLTGHNSAMFSGEGGQAVSEKVLYEVSEGEFSQIGGKVSFIKTGGEDGKSSVTIKLHVKDASGTAIDSNPFVTLVLHRSGDFQFSLTNGDVKQGSIQSETGVFKFEIVESSSNGRQRSFRCDITAHDSEEKVSVSLTTESEPVGGYALISSGAQSDAILVQDVSIALAMPGTAGGRPVHVQCWFQIFAVISSGFFYIFLQI